MVRPENTLEDQVSTILSPASLQFINLIYYLTSIKWQKDITPPFVCPTNGPQCEDTS